MSLIFISCLLNMTNIVRESAQFIASKAKHVTIDEKAVEKLSQHLLEVGESNKYNLKSWKEHDLFPKVADETAVAWIFVSDVLNFNFWNDDDTQKCVIKYKGQSYTGYMAMAAALNRAIDNGMPILDPKFYANITDEQVEELFRPDSGDRIPLFEKRVETLREAGRVLNEKFGSSFVNCIKQAGESAQVLLNIITENFPAFRDEAVYEGRRVAFYKRAQILISDLWACFEGEGLGHFFDIDTLTMFADYRIPQVLVYFGVMKYSAELQALLDGQHVFPFGDPMECEIRGCTIHAVDLLYQKMKELRKDRPLGAGEIPLNVILIDHYLWDYRRDNAAKLRSVPYHKVRCIYY